MSNCIHVETAADAAAMFRAALPKEQKEERVFVLPLDGNGKARGRGHRSRRQGRAS